MLEKDKVKFKISSIPVNPQAINDAIAFINNSSLNYVEIPYISMTEGGISFWWDKEAIKFGLEFYGDGTYSYYAKLLKNGEEFFGDGEDLKILLPLEIVKILNSCGLKKKISTKYFT
jgi:hypothetical protein